MASTAKKYDRMKGGNALKNGWKIWRFDQIATIVNDRVDNPAEANVEHYVGLEHLDSDSLRIRRWGKPGDVEATKLRFRKGDIIFGRRRVYQRKLGVADFDGICSAHAMVLRAKPEAIVPDFLPFFMQSDLFMNRAMEISVGSLSPTINWRTLAAQEFSLPPMEEQRRIVDQLDVCDEAAMSLDCALHQHSILISAFLQQTLSRFDREYPHRAARDLMRDITVGIVVKPADLYVERGRGVVALRSLNVFPDRFVLDDVVEISKEGHTSHSKSALEADDIVVVRTGRPGDAAVIPDSLAGTNCIDLIVARPGSEIDAQYVVTFLNSSYGRRIFASGTTGTAQKHFNVGEFSKLKLPVPPIKVQKSFVEQLTDIREPAVNITKRRNQIEAIRKLTLSQVFGTQKE